MIFRLSTFSAAGAAAAASSAAVAAAAAAGGAVDYLYFCAGIGSNRKGIVSMVQGHARNCGLSYESAVAGYKYNGSKFVGRTRRVPQAGSGRCCSPGDS